jgi:hypothetical protein
MRLLFVQFWRATPLPGLRLALLLGMAIVMLVRDAPPSGPAIALWLAAAGAWVVPTGTLARDRLARARLAGALPLDPIRRSGRAGPLAIAALLAPIVLSGAAVAGRALLEAHHAPRESPNK